LRRQKTSRPVGRPSSEHAIEFLESRDGVILLESGPGRIHLLSGEDVGPGDGGGRDADHDQPAHNPQHAPAPRRSKWRCRR
jgi:hypothetical protein